jgi:hypothetical protein
MPGAEPFEPMPGRVMSGYAVLPEAMLGEPDAVRAWLERAHDYAATLPAKQPKPPRRRR